MENYDQAQSTQMAMFFSILLIPMLFIWLVSVIGLWKVYQKAGKPGWACIIPIYNVIVLLEIIGKPLWWFLLLLIAPGRNFP